jgi:hypothetical protein
MKFEKCFKCNTYHFDTERCPDEFTIFEDDYLGEEGKQFRGYNFDDAAENYGKYRNDEGQLLDDPITVEIEDSKGNRKKFTIDAEVDIRYNVNEIK